MLSAREAAAALAGGFERAGLRTRQVPLADGGEGTMEVLHAALGGEWRATVVPDPLGRPVEARWLVLSDGRAVVESAEAIGLWRLAADEYDPLRASSRGLGELLAAALAAGPRELLVALGGTATVDGGRGLGDAGIVFPNKTTTIMCDVTAPLLGPRGAAYAYGPQKGATPSDVRELEGRLAAMEELRPFAELPGAGAAGGLGAALAALGGRLVPGADFVLEALGFRERVRAAALVVTGEGAVDATTVEGKAPAAVLRICREEDVRCVVFGGRVAVALDGAEMRELSGRPGRARADLAALGEALAESL